MERESVNLLINSSLIFYKGTKPIQWEKKKISNNDTEKTGYPFGEKMNTDFTYTTNK